MKKLQQISMGVVVSLTLSVHAYAGHIGIPEEPPPPATASGNIGIPTSVSTVTPGETQTLGEVTASDSVANAMLSLIQAVLSVF